MVAYIGFDTETLGLKTRRPENLLQLSMIYEDTDPARNTTGVPVDKLDNLTLIVDPGEIVDRAEIQAIVMNTWIFQEILKARRGEATEYAVVKPPQVAIAVRSWMARKPQRPYLVGQNVGAFDLQFLHPELHSLFHYRTLEIGSAFYDPTKGPLSLGEAKEAAGFDKNVAHDARREAMDYILMLRTKHGGNTTPYPKP